MMGMKLTTMDAALTGRKIRCAMEQGGYSIKELQGILACPARSLYTGGSTASPCRPSTTCICSAGYSGCAWKTCSCQEALAGIPGNAKPQK